MDKSQCPVCLNSNSHLIDEFQKYNLIVSPREFYFCEHCFHLYQKKSETKDLKSFDYLRGERRTMRSSLRDLSFKIEKRFNLKAKDIVLDIASNDGTFLRTFDIAGLVLVGVESESGFIDEAKTGLDYFIHDSWNARSFEMIVGRKAKVITSLFALPRNHAPLTFLRDIESSLRDDGICILEVPTLCDFFDFRDLGIISSETTHLFSLKSLKILIENAQLEIFDLEQVVVGGHALRLYCRKKNSYVENENGALGIRQYLEHEKENLNIEALKKNFFRLDLEKKKLKQFLLKAKEESKTVWVYGLDQASDTLLNFFQIKKEDLSGIYELSDKRAGQLHPILNLRMLDKEQMKKEKPDYFLVLPYHFINEFYQTEVDRRQEGTIFVLPLPEFRVVE